MTILIVEDNATNAMILKRIAEKVTAEDVVVEPDAGVALKRCHGEQFSFLIVDQIMPGMSGVQFIKAVRMIGRYDDVPIVMVTADHEPKLRDEAIAAGVRDFLTKPIDTVVLRSILSSHRDCEETLVRSA